MNGNHQPETIRTFRFYQEVLVALSVATELQMRQGFIGRIDGMVLKCSMIVPECSTAGVLSRAMPTQMTSSLSAAAV